MTTRRSFFKALGAGLVGAALPKAVEAKPVLPQDYEIDFELLTPWDNLTWDMWDQNEHGFDLEISVNKQGDVHEEYGSPRYVPYEGKIRWWVLPTYESPREKALLSGVAEVIARDQKYFGPSGWAEVRF